MPRSRKTQVQEIKTAEEGMEMIVDALLEKSIDEAAKIVGVAEVRLLEMFYERLELPEAMVWETIPTEHEALLAEFKQEQDAFNSVRQLNEVSENDLNPLQTELQQNQKIPAVEEEQKQKKKRQKRNSTALTQTKTEEITQTVNDKEKLAMGEEETLQILYGERGRASGANLATSELYIRQLAYSQTKGDALNREIAVLVEDIVKLGQFSPEEIAQKLGLNSSQKQYNSIHEVVVAALSKIRNASEEIHDTAWKNGKDVQNSLSMLDSLMN